MADKFRIDRKAVDPLEWFYRRGYASPERKYMNPDGTATSRVFKLRDKDNGQPSVDIKSMTTPENAIGDQDKFMLFEISNKYILSLELGSFHDPLNLQEHGIDNPAHAVIVGFSVEDEITPGLLARGSNRYRF
ncbi:MAG: hypothetical protein AAF824_22030 [Bacteroidota bacterium]